MNIALIFAGGSGMRMHSKDRPKQFLLIHGKPIIVHTIEIFERHQQIDGIVVSCIESWIPYMEELAYWYRLDKIKRIVPGGSTGQLSIYNGLQAAAEEFGINNNIVLIHDGVRPLITEQIITDNIRAVQKYGSAITSSYAKETFILVDDKEILTEVPSRAHSRIAKAPQSFWLDKILAVHKKALADGNNNVIDSCTLMRMYGESLHIVNGPDDNIKITTPEDFYMFRALYDARENDQIRSI